MFLAICYDDSASLSYKLGDCPVTVSKRKEEFCELSSLGEIELAVQRGSLCDYLLVHR